MTLLQCLHEQILLNKLKGHHPQHALTHAGFSLINQFIRLMTATHLFIEITNASQSPYNAHPRRETAPGDGRNRE